MFKIDFVDGDAITWERTKDGIEAERHKNYYPRFYLETDEKITREAEQKLHEIDEAVSIRTENWKTSLSSPEKEVLRIDTEDESALKRTVGKLKDSFHRGNLRFYNVGISPQFRFCLQRGRKPVPEEELRTVEMALHRKDMAEEDLSGLRIDGEDFRSEKSALEGIKNALQLRAPDLLIVNRGQLLPLIRKKIAESDMDFRLGRMPVFQELAGENTVSSYGKTVHSNARYNVPGRAVIDRSNSFLLDEATLEGLWDLVDRSYRPVQELAWGSIGRLLTSIEVRKAYLEENTLTPWKNWTAETPKTARNMHRADRGGFIFNPDPGVHEDVYEADFASLFPNIMVKKNISPETVNCGCCMNSRVPELDYSICEKERGFIPEVLKPLVEDRQEMKDKVEGLDGEEKRYVQGGIDAIKWLLVSCFGYMGHAHASYGSIECHQAIQAFDRSTMVRTKEIFEEHGYEIVHGIIDSIWVKEKQDAAPIEEVCKEITEEIGIELEFEHSFDWVAFVPRSSSEANISTLNRYFGKKSDGGYKTAGIEVEQSSSPAFIREAQEEMIEAFDMERNPEQVLNVLKHRIEELEKGEVPPEDLVVEKKASKNLEDYSVDNRTAAALKRAEINGIEMKPGQRVRYVVREDQAPKRKRVRLEFESEQGDYDPDFYRTQLIRAAESILSPSGMDREDIRKRLEGRNQTLQQAIK